MELIYLSAVLTNCCFLLNTFRAVQAVTEFQASREVLGYQGLTVVMELRERLDPKDQKAIKDKQD